MPTPPARLLITNTHLLPSERSEMTDTSWLGAPDGRIAAPGQGRPSMPPEEVSVPETAGAPVMPGLIGALVHWPPPDPRRQGPVPVARARGRPSER